MKFYFHAEDDDQNPIAEFTAPTIEMLEEKIGAWERSQELLEGKNALPVSDIDF